MVCEMGRYAAFGLAIAAVIVVTLSVHRQQEQARTRRGPIVLEDSDVPKNLPTAFAEEAARIKIESAIRRAAASLERSHGEQERLEREYAEKAAKAEVEGKKADMLLSEGKTAATKAVQERAEWKVAESKADTDAKTVELDKKMASLMAFRSQSLKIHAQHRAAEAKELQSRAVELMKHREELFQDARKEGEEADAVVATAGNLLRSAKELSKQAQHEKADGGEVSALDRLKLAEKEAKEAMDEDMEKLAKAKLKHKGLTGVEGVDELSRAEEQISDVERRINQASAS